MSGSRAVTAFAPATVGNVVCGFDVLGLALESPGDRVTARLREGPGVVLTAISGDDGRLSTEAGENAAGAAVRALLDARAVGEGVALELEKGLPLAGGMGGSAASAVAAVVAADALLELGSTPDRLLEAALEGERVAAGSAHPDNAAPALLGGIVLARRGVRRPVVSLPVPPGLSVALLHPRIEMSTREARSALGTTISLEDAVAQWGNTAALVAALFEGDLDLLSDALEDRVAEPVRGPRVPGFGAVKEAALAAGALGCSLSGAGPSIVALCREPDEARSVGAAMRERFTDAADVPADLHLSPVGRRGARVLEPADATEGG